MPGIRALRSALVLWTRRFTGKPTPGSRRDGTPSGLEPERLDAICKEHFGKPLKQASYKHLSGWKAAGAFRIFLTLKDGLECSLIFKNAVYDADQIPALEGLPVLPGPAEYAIYQHPGGSLARYLPAVYLAEETVPGKQYHYLLEDLGEQYVMSSKVRMNDEVPAKLAAIHAALGEWQAAYHPAGLLCYDQEFSTGLQTYARETLEQYGRPIAGQIVDDILRLWTRIMEVYSCKEYVELQPFCWIHGDLNGSNIFIHREDPQQIKLLDWEWAGYGPAFADLASLLKGSPVEELEKKCLLDFLGEDQELPLEAALRLYRWCKLERNLLDATFLINQAAKSTLTTRLNVPEWIEESLRQVIHTYQSLA